MADFALDNQKLFENQNLLEIGAGTGLSSIILSNHCKTKEVFVTDLPDLLPLLKGVRLWFFLLKECLLNLINNKSSLSQCFVHKVICF